MEWSNVEEIFSQTDFNVDSPIHFSNPDLTKRLKKTLYYSPNKNPCKDTLSFSVTKAAVESFRKAAPTSCGKLGLRYASRVARDACLSPCAMILAMIYVERLAHKNPDYLQRIQSSDLFLITMMVASKYLYDEGTSDEVYNDEWAISGLAETDYVNDLESDFLHAINWRIFTRQEEFCNKLMLMEARLAYIESFRRGWLTYTEMSCLLQSKRVRENLQKIVCLMSKVICFSAVLYCGVFIATWSLTLLAHHQVVLFRQKPIKASFTSHQGAAVDRRLSLAHGSNDSEASTQIPSSTFNQLQPFSDDYHDKANRTFTRAIQHKHSNYLSVTEVKSSRPSSVSHQTEKKSPFHVSIYFVRNYTHCRENSKLEISLNRQTNSRRRIEQEHDVRVRERSVSWFTEPDNLRILLESSIASPQLPPSHFQHQHCTLSAVEIF